jgi:hypothetical protein
MADDRNCLTCFCKAKKKKRKWGLFVESPRKKGNGADDEHTITSLDVIIYQTRSITNL